MHDDSSTVPPRTNGWNERVADPLYVVSDNESVAARVKRILITRAAVLKRPVSVDRTPLGDRPLSASDTDDMPSGLKSSLALSLGLIGTGALIGVIALIRDRSNTAPVVVDSAEHFVAGQPIAQITPVVDNTLTTSAERLVIDTQPVVIAEVVISKEVVSQQQSIDVPVTRDELFVERRPIDELTVASSAPIGDGPTIHVPLSEDHVNVEKQIVLTDEFAVGKRHVEGIETVNDTLRHEELHSQDASLGSIQPPPTAFGSL